MGQRGGSRILVEGDTTKIDSVENSRRHRRSNDAGGKERHKRSKRLPNLTDLDDETRGKTRKSCKQTTAFYYERQILCIVRQPQRRDPVDRVHPVGDQGLSGKAMDWLTLGASEETWGEEKKWEKKGGCRC